TVGVGSSFDGALAGGGEVVVPVRMRRRASLGREHVDRVVVAVVGEVHRRIDLLAPPLAAAVMQQGDRCTFEMTADSALVRTKLSDDLLVPAIRCGHVTLLATPWLAHSSGCPVVRTGRASPALPTGRSPPGCLPSDQSSGTDLALNDIGSLSPQLTMRLGVILNISGSKPRPSSMSPVSRTSASPLTSMPRTRQGLTETMSSMTKATLGSL